MSDRQSEQSNEPTDRHNDYKPRVFLAPEVIEQKLEGLNEIERLVGRALLEAGRTDKFERLLRGETVSDPY